MSSAGDQKSFSDFVDIFQKLSSEGFAYVLGGGQAANLWAQVFESDEPELAEYRPYTSKDADVILIRQQDVKALEKILGGKVYESDGPQAGQFAIFISESEPRLELDILTDLFGIYWPDRKRMINRSREVQGVQVIDPLYLLKSKLLNLEGLDQNGRQDKKHVLIAMLVIRAHLRRGLKIVAEGELDGKKFKKELKLLLALEKNRHCRIALDLADRRIEDALPIEELQKSEDETVQKFVFHKLRDRLRSIS